MTRRAAFATTAKNARSTHGRSRTIRIPPLPLAFIGLGLGCLGVGLYEYLTSDIQKYPPDVRQALRKALYYQTKGESTLALKYFGESLDLALKDQTLMTEHPDHVTGIIIQLGAYLESLGRLPEARQTLVLALRHLCRLDSQQPDEAILDQTTTSRLDALPHSDQRKIAGVAQKLADVLVGLKRDDEAERYYTWSVEHLLRLSSKPASAYGDHGDEIVFDKEHMPSWLTQTEVGAALEALGGFYAKRNKYSYAIPLYLKALDLAGINTCHAAVLMNNLSDAYAALGRLDEAKLWAQRGLDLAQNPNTRKLNKDGEICDETCGVLLYNTGMLFECIRC
ncbi:hypothetical protein BX666DRAFT_2018531 [Dichotomocladium elegans]|nr:hypothetical protein BX666DRAFT_2018531 [Dichotomocladium elegans]